MDLPTSETVFISSHAVHETQNFKTLLLQATAASAAASCNIVAGAAIVYSAILLPQLNSKESDITVTESFSSWIASVFLLVSPVGGIIAAIVGQRYGRLNGLKFAALPSSLGWIIIALAPNANWIIVGRIMLGLAQYLLTNLTIIYITEISSKDVRGALTSLASSFLALGMFLTYLTGWFLNWRTVAWVNLVYIFISSSLMCFLPESPYWLINKNRVKDAKASLIWFYKHQPEPSSQELTFAELKLEKLIEEERQSQMDANKSSCFREFCNPTCYKPLLILCGLHFFQQFSGIYSFLFYSVYFFESSGTSINPYLGSVILGLTRFLLSLSNTWVMKKIGRRMLLIVTTLGMGISMLISGTFTYLIEKGNASLQIAPTVFLLSYVFFSIFGLMTIPWTMTAEMFPFRIRTLAQSLTTTIAYELLFVAIQNYYNFQNIFGGFAGAQWFYSAITLLGALYIYAFLPETHNKSFAEIEQYFKTNIFYCTYKNKN